MVADGLIRADQATPVAAAPRPERDTTHPLVIVARCEWQSAKPPHQKLTVDVLVQWLAQRTGVPYLRIDPLMIDVAQATAMVSYAYAARANVLPVRVTAKEATIATADPFQRDWERELKPILNREIKRV